MYSTFASLLSFALALVISGIITLFGQFALRLSRHQQIQCREQINKIILQVHLFEEFDYTLDFWSSWVFFVLSLAALKSQVLYVRACHKLKITTLI